MPHFGSQLSPTRGRITVGKLDKIQRIVDIRLQIVYANVRIFVIIVVLVLTS